MISPVAIQCDVIPGYGNPNFVNLPTPWLVYTNFRIPSQKKTDPAIRRMIKIEDGPATGGLENQLISFLISFILSECFTNLAFF
jgi:hypothetical protein